MFVPYPEERKALRHELFDGNLTPHTVSFLENSLIQNQKDTNRNNFYLIGSKISLADIAAMTLQNTWLSIEANKGKYQPVFEKFPLMKKYWEVRNEEIMEYLEKRPKSTM